MDHLVGADHDITDEARSILIRQPFKARFYRVAGYVDAFAISVIFEKFDDDFRARFNRQPLVVSSDPKKAKLGIGQMRFTNRMLTCVQGAAEVHRSLYHAASWLPEAAMREYSDPLGTLRRLEQQVKLEAEPDEVEVLAGDFSPEDLDAFRDC